MCVLADQRKQGPDSVTLGKPPNPRAQFFSPRMEGIMFLSTITVNINSVSHSFEKIFFLRYEFSTTHTCVPSCTHTHTHTHTHRGFPDGASGKESSCECRRRERCSLIPGLGRSPGGGNGSLLQYSCLESPHGQRSLVDCLVHGVAKSWTRPSS